MERGGGGANEQKNKNVKSRMYEFLFSILDPPRKAISMYVQGALKKEREYHIQAWIQNF